MTISILSLTFFFLDPPCIPIFPCGFCAFVYDLFLICVSLSFSSFPIFTLKL